MIFLKKYIYCTFKYCNMFLHQVEEVAYVDAQRNVAVTFGERDVKKDVRAKNK